MAKDYYKTLGIEKSASKEEIKKAYRKFAKKYHPDINKDTGSKEKMQDINEAYSILSDETKRSNYDRFGDAGEAFAGGHGNFTGEEIFEGFEDIFSNFFGGNIFGGRRRRGPRRGADLKYELDIDFEEAVFGVKKKITVTKHDSCKSCKGTGAEDGELNNCETCQGRGAIRKQFRTPFGVMAQTTTCPECRGLGKIAKKECKECRGKGRVKKTKTITVTIPEGVDTGSVLRLSGEGEAGEVGAPSGDLYVEIHSKPHKIFEREGEDIYLEYPLSFSQVALGDEVKVPTLHGEVKMKIPSGTQSHTVFRLKNKGVPRTHGYGQGDQHVRVVVKTPEKLNKKQKQLFKDLAKENKEKLQIEKDFFTKVRDVLLD